SNCHVKGENALTYILDTASYELALRAEENFQKSGEFKECIDALGAINLVKIVKKVFGYGHQEFDELKIRPYPYLDQILLYSSIQGIMLKINDYFKTHKKSLPTQDLLLRFIKGFRLEYQKQLNKIQDIIQIFLDNNISIN